jgi:DNA-directed RNA polymerase specialized sigma24 family protein
MSTTKSKQPIELPHEKAAAGLLALQLEDRETRIDQKHEPRKSEVVLAGAGLSNAEIAALLGKQPNAVGMTISRATKPKKRARR